jgi:hypothetical protein
MFAFKHNHKVKNKCAQNDKYPIRWLLAIVLYETIPYDFPSNVTNGIFQQFNSY